VTRNNKADTSKRNSLCITSNSNSVIDKADGLTDLYNNYHSEEPLSNRQIQLNSF